MNFSLGIDQPKPRALGEYEMVDKSGGIPINTHKNYLYIRVCNAFVTTSSNVLNAKIFKGCYAFISSDVFPAEDPSISLYSRDVEKTIDYMCDMNGRKVIP